MDTQELSFLDFTIRHSVHPGVPCKEQEGAAVHYERQERKKLTDLTNNHYTTDIYTYLHATQYNQYGPHKAMLKYGPLNFKRR